MEKFAMSQKSTGNVRSLAPTTRLGRLIPGLIFTLLFVVSCRAGQTSLTPPPDYLPLAEVDLSARSYDGEVVGEIEFAEPAVVGIYYTIPNLEASYFDLRLIGSAGDNHLILHSEDYRTDEHGGGTWTRSLPPGVYQLALTTQPSPAVLAVYWGTD